MREPEGLQDFIRKLDQLAQAYNKIPTQVAAIAVRFSKERFVNKDWHDTHSEPWQARKYRRKGGKGKSQALLVNRGDLKKSVRKIYADQNQVVIGSDLPYAQIHNDGGTVRGTFQVKEHEVKPHTRKAHTRTRMGRTERIKKQQVKAFTRKAHKRTVNFTIPQRQFLGQSAELEQRIVNHIETAFKDALN